MYKLRRSRFVKFIAGLLVFVLCAAIVGNLVGTYIIMDENLYYASRQQVQQKIYSYVYEYTASDLMRYLKTAEKIYSNDEYYRNYNQSELDLFKEKYSANNTNIQFEIFDEFGNLLLKNDNEPDIYEEIHRFSSGYGTDYSGYDSWYNDGYFGIGGSDQAEILTTSFAEGTTEEGVTSLAMPSEDETVPVEAVPRQETTTYYQKAESSVQILPADDSNYKEEVYILNNEYSGNPVTVNYRYKDEIKEEIFNHIRTRIISLTSDITEITVYQDDFYIEYYDESSYDGYEIFPRYNTFDNRVPTKSFSTTVLTNDKEVALSYTWNGSLSFSQLDSRLRHISLTVLGTDEMYPEFNINQKERTQIKVQVTVPCNINGIRDIYYYAEKFTDLAIGYRDNIISISVFYFILLIMSLVFVFWSAGYVPKRDEPKAGGLHAIPFDLYLILSALGAVGCYALIDTTDELFMFFGFTGWAVLLIALIYTIPVRIRTKTLCKNTLISRIYRSVKHAAEVTDEATGSRLAIIIILFTFIVVSLAEAFFFNIWGSYEASAIIFVARIIEIPFVIFALVALTALHNGARAISKGDTSYRISSSLLFGPFKKHADYLNNINDGVNKAVEERLRSESLKTELITNVSHDLKTPLTSIVNYIDLLKKTEVKDPKAREYIEVIDRQSQRLKKLTIDIVEASKAATGNVEVNYEDTALNVILLQTNGEYIERLQEKSLTLVQEIPDEEIRISTDGRLLWRVIDNLMNNICKYSMPGTRVYLTLWENNGRAFISFRNISRSKLNITPDTLTERFVRGDSSRNTEGSGLGLSIANSLTEIMGGKLSIIIDGDLFKVTLSFPTIDSEE